MAINLDIKADVRGVALMLTKASRQAIPAAERAAVNALAFDVMRAERLATKSIFENPRPFTQKAFLVEQAKSLIDPAATVYTRKEVEKYLLPYEYGGNHVLPGQAALIPVDAQTDAYGQLPKGLMAKLADQQNIYIGTIKGITGVWQRVNVSAKGNAKRKNSRGKQYHPALGAIKLLIRFGNAVPVTKHLNFEQRARSIVASNFMTTFRNALTRVLK